MMKALLFLSILITSSLFGLDVKFCAISDQAKHASNQKILSAILDEELASISDRTPQNQAALLSSKIAEIAKKLLNKGFALDAYSNPKADENSLLSFDCFALWEGEGHGSIPLTFLVYVWPAEEYALQYNSSHPRNTYYGSIIHSHPISCALAVLDGTMVQKNYELAASQPLERVVRLKDEEVFQKCEGAVDDLASPFIHQLYAKGSGSKPSLSLHVYGLPSEEKVMASFTETKASHSYNRVLKEDGAVVVVQSTKAKESALVH